MQENGWGRIVTVGSEAGRIGSKGNAAYAAAKGAVIAFTKSIARENARFAITANVCSPGPIETPLLREMSEHAIAVVTEQTQLKRLGTPEEVAAAVAFLASEAGLVRDGREPRRLRRHGARRMNGQVVRTVCPFSC